MSVEVIYNNSCCYILGESRTTKKRKEKKRNVCYRRFM